MHHNWWGEGVDQRMPRVRFGQVHVVNNYYNSSGNSYCVGAGFESDLLVENNVFEIYPQLKIEKDKLYLEGAVYSSMTGTGSTIYGIFKK